MNWYRGRWLQLSQEDLKATEDLSFGTVAHLFEPKWTGLLAGRIWIQGSYAPNFETLIGMNDLKLYFGPWWRVLMKDGRLVVNALRFVFFGDVNHMILLWKSRLYFNLRFIIRVRAMFNPCASTRVDCVRYTWQDLVVCTLCAVYGHRRSLYTRGSR